MAQEQKLSETEALDRLLDELSAFVCRNGPLLLTRGMSQLEANKAILECLKCQERHIENLKRTLEQYARI